LTYHEGMKKTIISLTLVWGLFAVACTARAAEETKIKRVPAKSTMSIEGKDLFREYCAVCHGNEARGGGPAAAALTKAPSDLTQITRRNAGKFPEIRIQRIINGEGDSIIAHGSRDMPVWGPIFRHTSSNEDLGAVKVYNLVRYIESIQAK